jgi:hypothetical protein
MISRNAAIDMAPPEARSYPMLVSLWMIAGSREKMAVPEGTAKFREETSKKQTMRRTALLRCTN